MKKFNEMKKCNLFKTENFGEDILDGDCRFDHNSLVSIAKTQIIKINDSKFMSLVCMNYDTNEIIYNHYSTDVMFDNEDIMIGFYKTEEEALKTYYALSYDMLAYNVPLHGMPDPNIYEEEEIKMLQKHIDELGGDKFLKEISDILYKPQEVFYKKFDEMEKCKPFQFKDMDPELLKMDCRYDKDSIISVSKTQILKKDDFNYFVIICHEFNDTHDSQDINKHYEKAKIYDSDVISYYKFSNEMQAINCYYDISYNWFGVFFVPPHGCPEPEMCNERELEIVIEKLNEK